MNTMKRCHTVAGDAEKSNHLFLEASIEGKNKAIEIPQYALRFANFDRVSLPDVKRSIYHPQLASMYKCQNDDFLSKFTIENARTSTALTPDIFIKDKSNRAEMEKLSHANKIFGDLEDSVKVIDRKKDPIERTLFKSKSYVAGREDWNKELNEKAERVFRFNRVREIKSDRPTQGHKPCYFDSTPAIDKFGRRVEAATASKFRQTNAIISAQEPFKPYGCAPSHYQNYIMNYPRI